MAFCSSCGTLTPDGAATCPACNRPVGATKAQPAGRLANNVAGMLAYVTIIPAIIFLALEPYNKNRFIRFHCFQSIFFTLAVVMVQIVVSAISSIPLLIFISLPLYALLWLASLGAWTVLLVKAAQGEEYKLPMIGDLAEKQAGV